ncbi:TATA-box factor binding protein [Cryptosporidium tyzzeri]|nr:TATA-box factor binding protein [Cryptosporidium tyzzeri]
MSDDILSSLFDPPSTPSSGSRSTSASFLYDMELMPDKSVVNEKIIEASNSIIESSNEIVDLTIRNESITPEIQNIIASVHLQCELDLRMIAISARNAEYNPKKVNAVVMRLRDPKCTGLLFRSGRLMITGARLENDAKLGGKKMAKICQRSGFPKVKFTNFKMENIIATADCKFPIRLEGLAYDHRDFCNYEPELFPGLVYRYHPDNSPTKAVLLLFVSGKVIVTGCKNYQEICNVFDNIYPVLCQYRK